MALVTPDFTEVQGALLPGVYSARVADVEAKTSKAGKPYLNWKLETFGANDAAANGRVFFHSTPTTGKGAFRLQELYKAAVGEDLVGGFDTEMLLGREVKAVLVDGVDQQGNAKAWPEVKSVSAL